MITSEALAIASLESAPAPAAPNPDLVAAGQRASQIRTEMGTDTSLAGFDRALQASRPVDVGARTRVLDANFGTERNPLTHAKTRVEGNSSANYRAAETALMQATEVLGAGIVTDQAGAIRTLESVMLSLPGFDTYIGSLDPTQRAEVINRILKDPRYMDEVRPLLEQATSGSEILQDEVTEAQRNYDRAEAARVAKLQERNQNATELGQARLDSADLNSTAAGTRGAELQELLFDPTTGDPRDLEGEVGAATLDVTSAQRKFKSRSDRLAALETAGKASGDSEFDTAERLAQEARDELLEDQKTLREKQGLKKKRDDLLLARDKAGKDVKRLKEDDQRLIDEYVEAEREALSAESVLNSKRFERQAAEAVYADRVQRILPDALRKYLKDRRQEAISADTRLLAKQSGEAKTEAGRKVAKAIMDRYLKVDRKGNLKGKNGARAKEDVAYMFNQKGEGPKGLLRSALKSIYPDVPNPAGGKPPMVENPEVAKYMSDNTFVEANSALIAQQALIEFYRAGGSLSAVQEAYLEAQPWGQVIAKSLEGVLSQRSEIQHSGNDSGHAEDHGSNSGHGSEKDKRKIGIGEILRTLALGGLPVVNGIYFGSVAARGK